MGHVCGGCSLDQSSVVVITSGAPVTGDHAFNQGVLDGKYDDLPEQSFYMVGGIDEMADPLTALMYAVQVMNFLKTLITKTLREREDAVIESSRGPPQEPPLDKNGDQGPRLSPHVQQNHDENEVKKAGRSLLVFWI